MARGYLSANGYSSRLTTGDFFEHEAVPRYDVVIGNPPYVRYQQFSGAARARSLEAALRQGVRLTQLASSWAAFTVHAAAFLKPEGRLGLVLPAELLSVKYAAQVRSFLLKRFRSVRLVLFEDLVFPGVLEEVVLLLAEGSGGATSFEVFQARNAQDLANIASATWTGFTPREDEKWTPALLSHDAIEVYERSLASGGFETVRDWGKTYLGAVTGGNKFFTLTKQQVAKLKLSPQEILRISPPGSRHLRGLTFSESAWEALADAGDSCYLFAPKSQPSEAAKQYIEAGKKLKIHKAYKCSVRDPWWQVPLVDRPDLLFAYMNHDRVRFIRNGAGVHLLNSLYGIKLVETRRELGQEALPLAALNSLTLLGAEIVGRAYGGGMLKHEPTEADAIPLPSFATVDAVRERLSLLHSQVSGLMRKNDINPAIDIVDRVILGDQLGFSEEQIGALKQARETLLQRRHTRGRKQGGED
ncbi:eco57I restriction-modification methylase family protein [Burkholderia pseudomallei MSHR684]|nr:eco57I restriction-modification methylase family protein [Burkholderia pseudomallei MSHR684]